MHLHLAIVLKKNLRLQSKHKNELLDEEFARNMLKKYDKENNSMKIRSHSKNYLAHALLHMRMY